MATPLEDVGKQVGRSRPLPVALTGLSQASRCLSFLVPLPQVWRGALFLADYILFQWDLFQGRTVLELGAGTGLTSLVAATVAQTVYCTGNARHLSAHAGRARELGSETGNGPSAAPGSAILSRWSSLPSLVFPAMSG